MTAKVRALGEWISSQTSIGIPATAKVRALGKWVSSQTTIGIPVTAEVRALGELHFCSQSIESFDTLIFVAYFSASYSHILLDFA